jgi:D-alanine-D-alanine ligase
MPKGIAIVYNEPRPSRYDNHKETRAVTGILACVDTVRQALLKLNYRVSVVPLSPPREGLRETLGALEEAIVFNLFEGFPGEPETEALVPEIFSEAGKVYTGCPAATLRASLDKFGVKKSLRAAGIPTPDFQLLSPQKMHLFRLGFPAIVKPGREDASHGITPASVVNDLPSLQQQVKTVYENYGSQAIVEEFIGGREFNVTVLGNTRPEVLPASEIVYTLPPGMPPILTYEAKWEPESIYYRGTQAVCPAKITARQREAIRNTAIAVYHRLDCSGYARVDMRLDRKDRINVIEINPNPDISPGAGMALQAAAAGMSYTKLIEKIIKFAWDREKYELKNSPRIGFRQNRLIADIKKHAGV